MQPIAYDVGARIGGQAEHLLGRHPAGRSESHLGRREALLRRFAHRTREAEVEHLDEVDVATEAAQEQVRGLQVAMDEPVRVRLAERVAHLGEPMHDATRLDGAEAIHEMLGVQAVQQLHRVEQAAVGGDAEVEQLDRVRERRPAVTRASCVKRFTTSSRASVLALQLFRAGSA